MRIRTRLTAKKGNQHPIIRNISQHSTCGLNKSVRGEVNGDEARLTTEYSPVLRLFRTQHPIIGEISHRRLLRRKQVVMLGDQGDKRDDDPSMKQGREQR